jgi:hypothetical protein
MVFAEISHAAAVLATVAAARTSKQDAIRVSNGFMLIGCK